MADPPGKHELIDLGPDDRPTYVYLVGLFSGVSEGNKWRLYLSPRLDCYAEFEDGDVVESKQIQANSPAPGFEATHVKLRRGAKIDFVYSRRETVTADDQFDLDERMEASKQFAPNKAGYGDPFRTMTTLTTPVCAWIGKHL
jgi:hypothetical protein